MRQGKGTRGFWLSINVSLRLTDHRLERCVIGKRHCAAARAVIYNRQYL
jgi:hypothetical protein